MKEKTSIKRSKTDWHRLSKMKDKEINTSDVSELGFDFFRHAELRLPRPKKMVSIRLDEDILSWFKRQGRGYQTKINEILKMYIKAKAA